jgi:hypothetical protein
MIVHSLEIIMVLMVCNNFLYSVKAVGYWPVSKLRRQKEAKILCQKSQTESKLITHQKPSQLLLIKSSSP